MNTALGKGTKCPHQTTPITPSHTHLSPAVSWSVHGSPAAPSAVESWLPRAQRHVPSAPPHFPADQSPSLPGNPSPVPDSSSPLTTPTTTVPSHQLGDSLWNSYIKLFYNGVTSWSPILGTPKRPAFSLHESNFCFSVETNSFFFPPSSIQRRNQTNKVSQNRIVDCQKLRELYITFTQRRGKGC